MSRSDLTPEQAAIVDATIIRQLHYLGKFRARMERAGITGEVYRRTCEAFDKVHRLRVELHYLSCKPGTVARAGGAEPPAR